MTLSDWRRVQRRDEESAESAFVRLARRVRGAVRRMYRRRDPAVAREDVELSVWRRILRASQDVSYGTASRFDAWVHLVARRTAIDKARRGKLREHSDIDSSIPACDPGPAEDAARRERVRFALGVVRELREPYRSVLEAYAIKGRSPREIARELGKSEQAVYKTLSRARGMAAGRAARCGGLP